MNLASSLREHARRRPEGVAVVGPDATLTYGELDHLADQVAHALRAVGVGPGDRVATWSEKSTKLVAFLHGVLRVGAAYVPLDPLAPPARVRRILEDCDVRCWFVSDGARARSAELPSPLPCISGAGRRDHGAATWAWDEVRASEAVSAPLPVGGDALAYILYTSGSTGAPKGVCVSHRNALAFVDGMVDLLRIVPEDRLSNHAPLHFDLSVFDLYAAFRAGAAVVLVPERAAWAPRRLVELLVDQRITVWYSVPSVLRMMLDQGGLAADGGLLRVVLFAGEVFPPPALAALARALPAARLLNLYGPTETNVCTLHEVPTDYAGDEPLPIGRACCGDRVWARADHGGEARPGEEGELMVEGPTVMLGYWGQPPQGAVYATGDLVVQRADGAYRFVGRRDHLVKIRGCRVELGEIEAVLATHPQIQEGVVVVAGEGLEARLVAFVTTKGADAPAILGVKQHCAARLPPHMVVHALRVVDELPRTSTGKVDRRRLVAAADTKERRDDGS